MRYSNAFIPTVKEVPKDATMPSHVLLLRGGYVRMVGAGIYEFLPLGNRVLRKIENIVREEMDAAGAQEVSMPAMVPAEYFKETGRWDLYGPTLVRIKDRKGGEYHLCPTHEEIITDMVRREVKSYRQLPINLYQIQLKYRDEPRPRAGLLRCREFIMKDAYSFDVDEAGATKSYEHMRDAYHRIFNRLGLEYRVVNADSGAIGGDRSDEFQVLAQTGEDSIVACGSCDYAANVEVAQAPAGSVTELDSSSMDDQVPVHTPNAHTISEVVDFLGGGLTPEQTIKCLVYMAGDRTVLAVVRGDHDVNDIKLARHLGADEVFLASDTAVKEASGTEPGFVGPVGFRGPIYVDPAAAGVLNAVAGANKKDTHLRNVNFGRDYEGEAVDIRQVSDGDPCPSCGSPLKSFRGIEAGHIFVLGTHYSSKMNATFLDTEGKAQPIVMGCYGIGVSRLVAATVEQNHDDNGICWPMPLAPYQLMLLALGKDDDVKNAADKLYEQLKELGVDVLYDDRNERPGVKFKDADLLGVPLRVTVGARGLKDGKVEVKARTDAEPETVELTGVAEALRDRIVEMGGALNRATTKA